MPELLVCDLGTVEHGAAHRLQAEVRAARQADAIGDVLLLVEHPPVYTRGRRSTPEELPMGELWYATQGIQVVDVDRGGKVTYHGPGQVVGYPICRVGDVLGFVGALEDAMVAALAEEGVEAVGRSAEGREVTGVWVGDAKIGNVGLHVSHGVTTHGFSVNVANDLQPFEWIVPCGLEGVRTTSVTKELGRYADPACFRRRVAHALAQRLGARQRLLPRAGLQRRLATTLEGR